MFSENKLIYSGKFYAGIIIIILSFAIAKIALAAFILYYGNPWIRWLSIIIYILTWPMLFLGVWWAGKEYAKALNKYFTYKFYHESVKEGTRKAISRTRDIHSKVMHKTKDIHSKVKERLQSKIKKNLSSKVVDNVQEASTAKKET